MHTHIAPDGTVYEHEHIHTNGETHTHKHVHSVEEKRAVMNRLARAIGHLESIRNMV